MGTKFSTIKVTREFNVKALHMEMQKEREQGRDVTLKEYLAESWGSDYTPEKLYRDLGINLNEMTVEKMLNTSELTRWLFPEVFRDAIRLGLEYTPFHGKLITSNETIPSTGVTMPIQNEADPDDVRLRDTNEGATITEGKVITWNAKQVTIRKKARGLMQTYESIMFTPINLAAIYFQELGSRLGSDLDGDLIDVAINGDQADGSEAAPVIGATTAGTLSFIDIVRAWVRFKRIGRNSTVMLMNEADALTVLNMDEFNNRAAGSRDTFGGKGLPTLNVVTPLPTSQDIYIHDSIPAKKIVLVDTARAFVQLTAMPLLIESERIVRRQLEGEYVSLITGFANVFKDGRMILDYNTNLTTNPGPSTTY